VGALVKGQDIHDLPLSRWREVAPDLVGSVVEVRILCVHAFGVGVQLVPDGAYGHVNAPRVTDGQFTVEETSEHIGEVRRALVLSAAAGRQPTLTIRPSEIPES
jgi:hypothetical protein